MRARASAVAVDAQRAIDAKTKPIGALGRLEEIGVRLAVLQGTVAPALERARICVFAADHGVADEGVSAYPKTVTAEMMRNFDAGGAAINVLARVNAIDVEVIDVGVDAALATLRRIRHEKVRCGSRNFLREPAMTHEELAAAMVAGERAARRAADAGVAVLGLGEMGIGNTTAASALLAASTNQSASGTVGRGSGITGEGLAKKRTIVDRALSAHVHAEPLDPRECLRRLGGLELAAIAGAAIEGARQGIAVVADGFISTVAVLAAARMAATSDREAFEAVRLAVFFAHRSTELGHTIALDACGAVLGVNTRPLFDLEMRLGEGTGAALAVPLLRAAAAIMRDMATFASAEISAGDHTLEHGAARG